MTLKAFDIIPFAAVTALALAASGVDARVAHQKAAGQPGKSVADPLDTPLVHPLPTPRPPGIDLPPVAAPSVAVPPEPCAARLARAGVEVVAAAPPPAEHGLACGIVDPVMLLAANIGGSPGQRVLFPSKPLISCALAERMGRFAGDIAAPLAVGLLHQPLQSIDTGPGYECRPRNRQAGAKMSSHGQGNALDIAAFTLADRRNVVVANPGGDDGQRYIWAVRMAGCGAFSTVLGPGSDAYHADHLHFDIEARGRDGASKFCQ